MKIVLVGYMGCGKTSIGKQLAALLQIPFIDLDEFISKKIQLSINEVFKNRGEVYFRKLENRFLSEILEEDQSFVLAVGGGTPCYGINMELINKNAISIYLKASILTLVNRLIAEKEERPLIAHLNEEDFPEFIGKHLFERNPFYQQSQFAIVTDDKTLEQIVDQIKKLLS